MGDGRTLGAGWSVGVLVFKLRSLLDDLLYVSERDVGCLKIPRPELHRVAPPLYRMRLLTT